MVEEMYLEESKELDNHPTPGQTGQESQNPNPSDVPQLQLHEDQKPRPVRIVGVGGDTDSLSSVVNSSHNSERGEAMRPYHHQLQQLPRPENNFGVVDMDFQSYNGCGGGGQQSFGKGVSLTLGLQQHNGAGVSLSFSPGSQSSTLFFSKEPMDNYQPMQFSILDGEGQNPPYRNLMGPQLLHDLSG
uniref:Homeobox protein BEL1 n=1 Tax=Anthurium amnicola TaxID=1678845 RepID=A0A1D1YVB0_9ARAE